MNHIYQLPQFGENWWPQVVKAVNEFFINKKFLVSQSCWIYEK